MKLKRWWLLAAAVLVALSAMLYGAHYLMFGDAHHIWIYLVGDIAFVPLEVLLVALVIERLLARHERGVVVKKMNMLVGVFFDEMGMDLLGRLTEGLADKDVVRPLIAVEADWSAGRYARALAEAEAFDYRIDPAKLDLSALRDFFAGRREFLVLLLSNPNLLEHDRFTDLLWAAAHLQDELAARDGLADAPPSDLEHLAGDVRRLYVRLTVEWLHYCRHLKSAYPFIFSIVMRTHPLQEHPDAVVL